MEQKHVNYLGLLRSPVSWARIGRELCEVLYDLCDLSIVEQKGFLYNTNFLLSKKLEHALKKTRNIDYEVCFEYPLNYYKMKAKVKIGGVVYETTKVPHKWVNAINNELDFLWLPNIFNKKIFLESGVNIPIIIAPYGINRDVFYPPPKNYKKNKFIFLNISMPQKRKGLYELINAFYMAFPNKIDVELIIKLTYKHKKFSFEYNIKDLLKLRKDERVKFIFNILTDKEIQNLFWNSSCYIQPSLSEGFGMLIFEAISSGLPVVVGGFGGHMDFLNDSNAFIVKTDLQKAMEMQYDNDDEDAYIGKIDIKNLSEIMRFCYENYNIALKKHKKALEIVDFLDWKNTAKILLSFMG